MAEEQNLVAILPETIIVPGRAAVGENEEAGITEVTFFTPTHLYTVRMPIPDARQLGQTLLGSGLTLATEEDIRKLH